MSVVILSVPMAIHAVCHPIKSVFVYSGIDGKVMGSIRVSHQAAKLKMALGRSQTLPLPQFLYAKVRNLDPELVKRLLSASQLFF